MLRAKRKNKNIGWSGAIITIIVLVIFVVYSLCLLYPYFYGLQISFMESGRAFMRNTTHFPWPLNFGNYLKAFDELKVNDTGYLMMLVNSLWYAGGSTVLGLFFSACTAYVICNYNFFGRKILYNMAIVIMMIPVYGSLPATFKLYSDLNIINSPLYLISCVGGFGITFIYAYAFFKSLSWSYAEAAFIDGASHFRVFISIMLPMLLPSLTALGIMSFIGCWNDYMTPLLYFGDMPTLASGLWSYERKIEYTANQPIYFAGVVISLLPILTIFITCQNTIMGKIYMGGLKG